METEHLPKAALNSILATRQQMPTEDNLTDFYWITLLFFWVLFERWVCKDKNNYELNLKSLYKHLYII